MLPAWTNNVMTLHFSKHVDDKTIKKTTLKAPLTVARECNATQAFSLQVSMMQYEKAKSRFGLFLSGPICCTELFCCMCFWWSKLLLFQGIDFCVCFTDKPWVLCKRLLPQKSLKHSYCFSFLYILFLTQLHGSWKLFSCIYSGTLSFPSTIIMGYKFRLSRHPKNGERRKEVR